MTGNKNKKKKTDKNKKRKKQKPKHNLKKTLALVCPYSK